MPRMKRNASISSDVGVSERTVSMAEVSTRNIPFKSVIKVFVVTSKPNYLLPWQMNRQEQCTGSAFYIGEKRLLTNAHVVRDWTTVRVRRHGGSHKYEAKVLCVNNACDLALLSVEEDVFWEGMDGLKISETIPELYENAMVIGYPLGGDNVCVTRGVVSRVTTLPYEDTKFFLPNQELIAIQLDAAINSGNSGGPALDENGRIVGVAFSGYAGSADNIGYIIPHPVIHNFLRQYEKDPVVSRVCDCGLGYMLCENPSLRKRYNISSKYSGVLVTKVSKLGAAARGGVKEHDVILSIDGCNVQNDGTIDFRQDERLAFIHKVGSRVIGESMKLEVLRNGKVLKLTIEGGPSPELVPRHRSPGTRPSYLIVGGIIFTALTCGLLDVAVEAISEEAWQSGRAAIKELGEQVIVIIAVLGHPVNHGYDIHRLPLLSEFNGKKVLNMQDLYNKVRAVKKGFLDFKLGDGKSFILDVDECKKTEEEILRTYAIPSAHSPDLVEKSVSESSQKDRGGKRSATNGNKSTTPSKRSRRNGK